MENKDQPKASFDPEDYRYLPPELLPNTPPVIQAWRFCRDAGDPSGLFFESPLSAFMAPGSGFIAQFAELSSAELVRHMEAERLGLDGPTKLGNIYYPLFGKIVWQQAVSHVIKELNLELITQAEAMASQALGVPVKSGDQSAFAYGMRPPVMKEPGLPAIDVRDDVHRQATTAVRAAEVWDRQLPVSPYRYMLLGDRYYSSSEYIDSVKTSITAAIRAKALAAASGRLHPPEVFRGGER